MAELLLLVMFVAAVLYTVLAGADFGAGLVESFIDDEGRERVDVALSPVWEANHIWLVLLAVLAFVGLPPLYLVISTGLHIPLLMVLLGIIARGAAFTFRHYDPDAGALGPAYSAAFRLGSLLTPLFLGVIVAATVSGRLSLAPRADFYATFIAPWNTLSCWLTGAFTCALFAFEGAALLAAENARAAGPLPYLALARVAHAASIALGVAVFASAFHDDAPWVREMFQHPLSLASMTLASLLVPVVEWAFRQAKPWLLRVAMGAQATCILFGFFAAQYPIIVRLDTGGLTLQASAAPQAVLVQLLLAVGVGLLLIVPGLVYLIRVYKR